MAGKWRLIQDVYDGPSCDQPTQFSRYLPAEPKEPPLSYRQRLNASAYLWKDKFRRTVNDLAAMLANLRAVDCPSSLAGKLLNIDNAGTSADAFVELMSVCAGKFGGCYVLVDYQGQPSETSALGEIVRSPYLTIFDPCDVVSFCSTNRDGQSFLDQIVIAQQINSPDGRYGNIVTTCYRVLTPGFSELWAITKGENGKEVAELLEQRSINDRSGNQLTEIPIAYYSTSPGIKFCGEPDLLTLAKLNIHLWQIESDLHNVMHRCNLPTPVIADDDPGIDSSGNPIRRELTLGPNNFISISVHGKAYFLEPSGTALAASKQHVDDVKAEMSQIGLDFLSGQSAFTATQSLLQSSGTSADIRGMARQLNSTLSEIKRLWCLFTLEADAGSLTVDDRLIQDSPPPVK